MPTRIVRTMSGCTPTWASAEDNFAKLICSRISIPEAFSLKIIALLALTPLEIYNYFTWTGDSGYTVTYDDKRVTISMPTVKGAWGYKNVSGITKVYMKSTHEGQHIDVMRTLEICDGSGATLFNPPDTYHCMFYPTYTAEDLRITKNHCMFYPTYTAEDLRITKRIAGTETLLAFETRDLLADPTDTEAYFSDGIKKIARGGMELLATTDNDAAFGDIGSIRIRFYNNNAAAKEAYIYPPLIILTG
jgi:hypothetical protein